LTNYFCLRPFRARFKKVERITLSDGQEVEIVVYSADYTGKIAQHTLFGTIIVDEFAFQSPRYLERVITHELAHKHQWYGYLAYPLVIGFGLLAFAMLFVGMVMLLLSLFFLNSQLAATAGHLLLFAIPVLVIPCAYSWFIEYKAEAATFRKLGIEKVLDIDKDLSAHPKAPLFWRIVHIMTHPPPKLTERIYRRFNPPETNAYSKW